MRQSKLFSKIRREAPTDEVSKNAKLLIRAGFVNKEMAGVYSFLPLGLRVLEKINSIIREEMNSIGGEEVFMSALQGKESWQKTDRWEGEVWFKTKLNGGAELGLGFTHEEPIVSMMKDHISSYKDLPIYVYQIQTKFRNEARAKSGLLRGREFLMKDLYSFSVDEKSHAAFYEKAKEAYFQIFNRLGLGGKTFLTFASGGSFSKYSHEFQTLTDAGEDYVHICQNCRVAVNEEIMAEQKVCPECSLNKFNKEKAVEVGNIFNLGTRFSEPLGLMYSAESGEKKPVVMGSYGIGPGRLMGTIVEIYSNENQIIWPESVSPFDVHLIAIPDKGGEVMISAEKIYDKLEKAGFEVLFDDREISAGVKFAEADLIGIPKRMVIGSKTLKSDKVEYQNLISKENNNLSIEEFIKNQE